MAIFAYDLLGYPAIYFILVQMVYAMVGAIFALFPPSVIKTFGIKFGPQVYTLVLLGGLFSSLLVTLLVQFLYEPIGVRGLFYVGAAGAIVSLGLNLPFRERLDI